MSRRANGTSSNLAGSWRKAILAGCMMAALLTLTGCPGIQPIGAVTPSENPPATQTTIPVEVTRVVTREIVVPVTPVPSTACAPATLAEAKEIVIGALVPLSQNSTWPRGLAMQTGLNIAMDEINAAGGWQGKPVRLVTYDTTGQPDLAARLAERLITQDCAVGLIDGFQDSVAAAVRQVSERFGTPVLVVEAAADELTASRPPTLFRLAPTATMMAQMPARWLADVGDYNGDGEIFAVLVAENTPVGDVAVAQASEWFPTYRIAHEVLRVDLPTQDFSPQIARIAAMDMAPDAVFLYVNGDTGLDLQRQLLDAGIGPKQGTLLVTGRAALDGPTFWQHVPDGELTVVGRRGPWATTLNQIGRTFVERYGEVSAQWPEPVAFSAYDAVHLLLDAAGRADSLAPADLVEALEQTNLDLASGRYTFPYNSQNPPDAQTIPDYLWHQWPDPPLLYLQYRSAQQDPATLDVIWPPAYRTTDGVIRN